MHIVVRLLTLVAIAQASYAAAARAHATLEPCAASTFRCRAAAIWKASTDAAALTARVVSQGTGDLSLIGNTR
jgi:hypothetical protein